MAFRGTDTEGGVWAVDTAYVTRYAENAVVVAVGREDAVEGRGGRGGGELLWRSDNGEVVEEPHRIEVFTRIIPEYVVLESLPPSCVDPHHVYDLWSVSEDH